eukprot:6609570-Prymnesium_polylepis.1
MSCPRCVTGVALLPNATARRPTHCAEGARAAELSTRKVARAQSTSHGAHVTRVEGHVTRVEGHVTHVVGHVTRVVAP